MSRYLITATWDDNAPHLPAKAKADLEASIPAYQKSARTKGIPQLGAGIIYPVADEELLVDPFPLPPHWPRGYALDVGWNRTAALWRAKDPETGISYFYDEHYSAEQKPEVHAAAIRRRGVWIPGKIDPAARGRSQVDGQKMLTLYRGLIYGHDDLSVGIRLLTTARNALEAGIYEHLMALQQGFLKVFRVAKGSTQSRCPFWMKERRMYRRDEKGRIVKKNDHAMDAARYSTASGDLWLAQAPAPEQVYDKTLERFTSGGPVGTLSWMGNI